MLIPAAAAAPELLASIGCGRVAPVVRRQRGLEVRRESNGEHGANFIEGAGALRLTRQARFTFVAVHDRARGALAWGNEVGEVQSVVGAEADVRDEEVERPEAQAGA